jgi:outer membrane protein TolC
MIIRNAEKSFKAGEITYMQYQQSLSSALKIKTDYIENIYQLNIASLAVESITGIK